MRTLNRLTLVPVLLAMVAAPSFARHHKSHNKTAKAATCPACHMTLATVKSDANPREVKIHGKTYYCCAGCDMSKKSKTK